MAKLGSYWKGLLGGGTEAQRIAVGLLLANTSTGSRYKTGLEHFSADTRVTAERIGEIFGNDPASYLLPIRAQAKRTRYQEAEEPSDYNSAPKSIMDEAIEAPADAAKAYQIWKSVIKQTETERAYRSIVPGDGNKAVEDSLVGNMRLLVPFLQHLPFSNLMLSMSKTGLNGFKYAVQGLEALLNEPEIQSSGELREVLKSGAFWLFWAYQNSMPSGNAVKVTQMLEMKATKEYYDEYKNALHMLTPEEREFAALYFDLLAAQNRIAFHCGGAESRLTEALMEKRIAGYLRDFQQTTNVPS